MISFDPDEEQKLLAGAAARFAAAELRPRLRAHEAARAVSPEVRAAFHALGLVGVDLPAALGFAGLPLIARALVEEELGAGDAGASFALDAPGLAGQLIAALGTPAQQARWLAPFLSDPDYRAALAAAESAPGPDFACVAERDGEQFVIRGEKRHVLGGARAQLVVVLAQVERGRRLDGAAAFVVERGSPDRADLRAAEDRDPIGLAEAPPCSLIFDGVRVPASARLEGDLRAGLRAAIARQSLAGAARALGSARASFEVARKYAGERTAFGKPIGHFQAIAFLLADMATEIEGARALLWRGCSAVDQGAPDAALRAAQAVAHAHAAAFFAAHNAVQILGGAGYVEDHPVEKWMRDVKAAALYALPTQGAQAIAMAEQAGDSPADEDAFAFVGPQPALT